MGLFRKRGGYPVLEKIKSHIILQIMTNNNSENWTEIIEIEQTNVEKINN